MSLYLKIEKQKAEKTRKRLLDKDVYDGSRKVQQENGFVYFPIKEEIQGYRCVDREGEKIKKRPRSLREALKDKISDRDLEKVPSSFDVVGDIAVLELPEDLKKYDELIGDTMVSVFKNINTVAVKTGAISTRYRTRSIRVVAGEDKTETIHREHGLRYRVDVDETYFSPRLSHERKRVIDQIRDGERVLVLFAGVGPYAILASKKKDVEVVAVELNPQAVKYMRENTKLNDVDVHVVEGDAKKETPRLGLFDRIVMPLPKDAGGFLDVALEVLNPSGVIHYYTFQENTLKAEEEVKENALKHGYDIQVIKSVECGSYSPVLSRICVDFRIGT